MQFVHIESTFGNLIMIKGYAWILVWLSLVTGYVTDSYNCTRCSDFNRFNNPENKCPSNPNQCGDCNVGFRRSSIPDDGSCEKIRPPVLKQSPPSNLYVSTGDNVSLTCNFRPKDSVDCVWLRRGFHLEISNRYRFTGNNIQGLSTSDCSILINDFQNTDIGEWQCGSLADSSSEGVMSETITIALQEHFIETPKDSIVNLKDNITLKCTFDKQVDCVWLRRGFHLEISNRYSFINNDNGKMVTDCSLHITNFTSGDVGEWQCGSMADSQKEGILSHVTLLKLPANQTVPYPGTRKPSITNKAIVRDFETDRKITGKPQLKTEKPSEETTHLLLEVNIPPEPTENAPDIVFVIFIAAIVLLGFVFITGVVMLLYYKLCVKNSGNGNSNTRTDSLVDAESSQDDTSSQTKNPLLQV